MDGNDTEYRIREEQTKPEIEIVTLDVKDAGEALKRILEHEACKEYEMRAKELDIPLLFRQICTVATAAQVVNDIKRFAHDLRLYKLGDTDSDLGVETEDRILDALDDYLEGLLNPYADQLMARIRQLEAGQ